MPRIGDGRDPFAGAKCVLVIAPDLGPAGDAGLGGRYDRTVAAPADGAVPSAVPSPPPTRAAHAIRTTTDGALGPPIRILDRIHPVRCPVVAPPDGDPYSWTSSISVPNEVFGCTKATVVPREPGAAPHR